MTHLKKDSTSPSPFYWKSPERWADGLAATQEPDNEFPSGADTFQTNRRDFLKLMAASAGLVGLGTAKGARRPKEHILPYRSGVDQTPVGVPDFFASAFPVDGGHIPILVETHQARPTKIEGNPSYRPYGGATDTYTQASLLDLYDPDRLRNSAMRDRSLSLVEAKKFLKRLGQRYEADKGKGLVILQGEGHTPTEERLKAEIKAQLPQVRFAQYSPLAEGSFGEKDQWV